jgi:hypothetical protein
MTKLIPFSIEGQRVIQLSQLSMEQMNSLKTWLPEGSLKKINCNGFSYSDCLDFELYEYWYTSQKVGNASSLELAF